MNLKYPVKLEMYMLRCIIEVGSHYTWGYQATTRERLNSATKPRKNSPLSQKVSLSGIQCSYIFLCLWLNEQLGWTIYINITSWPNNQFTLAWAKVQIKAPAKAKGKDSIRGFPFDKSREGICNILTISEMCHDVSICSDHAKSHHQRLEGWTAHGAKSCHCG